MKIYQDEIDSGLEDIIKANASIAYACPVSTYIPSKQQKESIKLLVVAGTEAPSEKKMTMFSIKKKLGLLKIHLLISSLILCTTNLTSLVI